MTTVDLANSRPAWRDIRSVGPLLVVLFGLVLMLTPLASVGVTGSVGTAGVQCKVGADCPDTTLPPETTVPATDPTVPPDTTVPETDPTVAPTTTTVGQLPETGNRESNLGAVLLGGAFVVGGLGLLVSSRRRSAVSR